MMEGGVDKFGVMLGAVRLRPRMLSERPYEVLALVFFSNGLFVFYTGNAPIELSLGLFMLGFEMLARIQYETWRTLFAKYIEGNGDHITAVEIENYFKRVRYFRGLSTGCLALSIIAILSGIGDDLS